MQKELTITIDQDMYEGLHRIMDEHEISGFIETLVRPHVPGVPVPKRGIVELLAMPEDFDIEFEPPRLDIELYRMPEAL